MSSKSRLPARILVFILIILILLNLTFLVVSIYPAIQTGQVPLLAVLPTETSVPPTATPSTTPTPFEESKTTPLPTLKAMPASNSQGLKQEGLVILAMKDGNFSHLFAYHPLYLSLTRLTNNSWDDEYPAISSDGTQVAFSSRQNGYWNIFVLDMASGKISQITDTPEYDGAPTWSPDSHWIAYETFANNSLQIAVKSLTDASQVQIQLTNDSSMNSQPAWAPSGREIAFVSNRGGNTDIWLGHLDKVDDRFDNLSKTDDAVESDPAWSPDGRYLAWAVQKNSSSTIMIWDSKSPNRKAVEFTSGHHPVWSPDGKMILSEVRSPNQTSITGYSFPDHAMRYPLSLLPGTLAGMDWRKGKLPGLFSAFHLPKNPTSPAPALWNAALSIKPLPPEGRFGIVPLPNISAPFPYLNDAIDDSFEPMRHQVGVETGWDFLSSLENAYTPLTEPPNPDMESNWLFTGRAIAVNPVSVQAGWMVIVKEDYEGQTYWRIFLKARFQDGSMGKPMTQQPWDINARYLGKPTSFENGGQYGPVQGGYWVDFTEIAARYGWERLPSLPDWRDYYSAIRFNQYVMTDGLDWHQAMAEVYPPEALVTSTEVPTATSTPTETVTPGGIVRTPSRTPTVTLTPTLNPTFTPVR
jgi:TolB protein